MDDDKTEIERQLARYRVTRDRADFPSVMQVRRAKRNDQRARLDEILRNLSKN